ncbi:MAG: NADH-quinone oxidoreductase subunit N [Bdellovibrionota bacterium]
MSTSNFALEQLQLSIKHSIQARLMNEILPHYHFYILALPILLLLVGALVTMILGVFTSNPIKPSKYSWYVAVFVTFIASVSAIVSHIAEPIAFLGSGVLIDQISLLSFAVIGMGTLFTLLAASASNIGQHLLRSELLSLLLFSSAGLMIMCAAGEFISFFIGLEITSVSLYVLVGYQRKDLRAIEAAVKYFLLGATAAAVLLMGAALIYASIGSLRFADFHLLNLSAKHPFSLLGLFLLICGLVFKLAIAPFHSWAPDVYQGANSHLTGYMAALVKFSVAIVLMRILSTEFVNGTNTNLVTLFWIFGVLSIAIGSLYGLIHNSIKRMLAYSSIANAGYFCLAFASLATNPNSLAAKQALVSYAIIYTVLSLGAFTVIAWFEDTNREDLLKEELSGIGAKKPFAAFALSVFLFGFAGIPPVAGFFGKFFLILSAVNEGFIGLSIILVVFSAVSLYYYLSIMVEMWFKPQSRYSIQNSQSVETNSALKTLTLVAVIAALLIGFLGPRFAVNLNYVQAVEKSSAMVKK